MRAARHPTTDSNPAKRPLIQPSDRSDQPGSAEGLRCMPLRRQAALMLIYILATIQFAWCYLWITRPYVNTLQYEEGLERMPFQGRLLMMFPMRWAHHSTTLQLLTQPFAISHFWFPRPVAPEVLVQAAIDVVCLLLAGYFTT